MVEGKDGRGRSRKTWLECIRGDMKELELRADDKGVQWKEYEGIGTRVYIAKVRQVWKGQIWIKRLGCAIVEKLTLNDDDEWC